MIKDIVKDTFLLSQKAQDVKKEELYIAQDLRDTLLFHKEHCVGMAANMIGYTKKMIVFFENEVPVIMIHPEIIQTSKTYYETSEGCLSLNGVRKTKRYHKIKVSYFDEFWKKKIKTYEGFMAQIIQHEIDHLHGILI